jgi:hypothetical protein
MKAQTRSGRNADIKELETSFLVDSSLKLSSSKTLLACAALYLHF